MLKMSLKDQREPPYPIRHDGRPVIVHVVNSLDGGGTERTLVALLQAFDHSLFRHKVITLRAAGPLTKRLPDDVACRAIDVRGRSRWSWLALARILREDRADLIHARNTGCWADAMVAACLTRRSSLLIGFHGLETDGGFTGGQRRLARWAVRIGARFASVSEAGVRQLQNQARVPRNRIELLRNGVDLRRFDAVDETVRKRQRYRNGFDDSAFVVGIVGSLTPVKRHGTLLDAVANAAATLPGITLLIIGDGPLRELLEQQTRDAGIADRVRFTGWREDVPGLLACLDAYVCSSASEGMNNALLEAMAVGLPIIATDVGDNAAVVRDGKEGCIVKPGSAATISEALTFLAGRPGIRQCLAAAARTRAADYSLDRSVSAYESLYRSLLRKRRQPVIDSHNATYPQAAGVSDSL